MTSQHGDPAIRYIAAAPGSDQWVWSVIELKGGVSRCGYTMYMYL